MVTREINLDGLVGPSHNYAGLASGNIASLKNKSKPSNPRAAALQGLAKMKLLGDLGIHQAVLPPHPRPDMATLRRLGFSGSEARVLESAAKAAPQLLAACCSASAMWAANAATISPSADTRDGKVHITAANLVSQFHRSLETATTARLLKRIFPDESAFTHHTPLPGCWPLADEGAANHMRLAAGHGSAGIELFVHGRNGLAYEPPGKKYFARQTAEAGQTLACLHGVQDCAHFLRQRSAAIDAGAFHNDVVAVANENVLLYHEQAWDNPPAAIGQLRRALEARGGDLMAIKVKTSQVSLADAVRSYLFNSQLVTLPDGTMTLIAPAECKRSPRVVQFLDRLLAADTPIGSVRYVEVRQSMRNGGGPACLRLRVVLNEREASLMHPGVILTPMLFDKLAAWINRHYRDCLRIGDLADHALLDESRRALDELTGILHLGSVYDFQS